MHLCSRQEPRLQGCTGRRSKLQATCPWCALHLQLPAGSLSPKLESELEERLGNREKSWRLSPTVLGAPARNGKPEEHQHGAEQL